MKNSIFYQIAFCFVLVSCTTTEQVAESEKSKPQFSRASEEYSSPVPTINQSSDSANIEQVRQRFKELNVQETKKGTPK